MLTLTCLETCIAEAWDMKTIAKTLGLFVLTVTMVAGSFGAASAQSDAHVTSDGQSRRNYKPAAQSEAMRLDRWFLLASEGGLAGCLRDCRLKFAECLQVEISPLEEAECRQLNEQCQDRCYND